MDIARQGQNMMVLLLFSLGLGGGCLSIHCLALQPSVAQVQSSEDNPESSLLARLWRLNQDYLMIEPLLEDLPSAIDAVHNGVEPFDPDQFEQYDTLVQQIRQQAGLVEPQVSSLDESEQQVNLSAAIALLSEELDGLAAITGPLTTGINSESIRSLQEFLDFFEARNLNDADYGFYGEVTQTELTNYLSQTLGTISNTLKEINEVTTQSAIAPDLETSIGYLYNHLSFENALTDQKTSVPGFIQQLKVNNHSLRQQLRGTQLLFALFSVLSTGAIAWLYSRQNKTNSHTGNDALLNFKSMPVPSGKPADPDAANTTQDPPQKPEEIELLVEPETEAKFSEDSLTNTSNNESLRSSEGEDDNDAFSVQFLSPYDELVESYNTDISQLKNQAIALMPSTAALGEDHFFIALQFTVDEAGDYWAIENSQHQFLVPREGFQITSANIQVFQQLFTCYGNPDLSPHRITLLKPARVTSTNNNSDWELVQPGIISVE